jgi:hypothetical protein
MLAAAVVAACNGNGLSVEEALQRMVLQPEDLPGFVQKEATFTDNSFVASSNADPDARLAALERWGRILGYEIAYDPAGEAVEDTPVQGINVSASLYGTEEGAGESFADAVKTAQETDWRANYSGLIDFRQDEVEAGGGLADDIVWLRLSGIQPADNGPDTLVTDDLIFFREGRERGFLRVLTGSAETEDRAHYQSTVEGWLETLVGNVQEVLPQVEDGE